MVDALELNGFDRADIDVMADVETIRKRFGTVFVPVEDFADVPGAPRRAFVHGDDISMARATAFSVLFSIGATVAAMGSSRPVGGGRRAGSGRRGGNGERGPGRLATRHLGRDRAKLIETMIMEGGLVVWVRVRTEEAERQAEQIMRDGGAEAVRVHEVALDKRLSDLPLAGIVGDEVSRRA